MHVYREVHPHGSEASIHWSPACAYGVSVTDNNNLSSSIKVHFHSKSHCYSYLEKQLPKGPLRVRITSQKKEYHSSSGYKPPREDRCQSTGKPNIEKEKRTWKDNCSTLQIWALLRDTILLYVKDSLYPHHSLNPGLQLAYPLILKSFFYMRCQYIAVVAGGERSG